MKKALPVGIEDFKKIIDKKYYYIDKTLFIKELLDNGSGVSLFTRPRRFGKTLALSMLRYFFEKELTKEGENIDNSYLFEGLKFMDAGVELHRPYGAVSGDQPVTEIGEAAYV